MKKIFLILTLVLPFIWSCSDDDAMEEEDIYMPIHLSIPAESMPITKGLGDPGNPENNLFPQYVYVYFYEALPKEVNATGYNIDKLKVQLDDQQWKYVEATGVYSYTGNLSMLLSYRNILETGSRVMVVTSVSPLNLQDPKNLDELQNLQLDLTQPDNSKVDLQNVYANPWADAENGKLIKKSNLFYETSVTCYHVAARVDIQWDINPTKQKEYQLKTIEVTNLPKIGYLFKPKNKPASGVAAMDLSFTTNIGNQWYGRHVFYGFDCQEVVCEYTLNQGEPNPIIRTYTAPTQGTHSEVYSSWYRINASFGY